MAINGRRPDPIRWKYDQYTALLFTEIYLHWHFKRPADLLESLNRYLDSFSAQVEAPDQLPPFQSTDIKKLCFWQATGKTLLIHVNILQYLHHLHPRPHVRAGRGGAGSRHRDGRRRRLSPQRWAARRTCWCRWMLI